MTTPDHPLPDTPAELDDEPLHELADRQLLEVIAQTHTQLEHLQAEIERRMRAYAQRNLEAAQHAEIDRMVEHLERAKIDWSKVWEFFRDTLTETRHRDPWGTSAERHEAAPPEPDDKDGPR